MPIALTKHGASLHNGITRIDGRTIHFADGSRFEDATDIIFATGYLTEAEYDAWAVPGDMVGRRS